MRTTTLGPDGLEAGVIGPDEVPDGYRAMDRREALKVLVEP
ncbi:hypothetical protein [Streptomyces phaeoluteigriseus]